MNFRTKSFRRFLRLWVGQSGSLLGSAMTRFALAVYVWNETGAATPVILIGVLSGAASLLTSLAAGVVVDRWNRKAILIVSDLGAGAATLLLFAGFAGGDAALGLVYAAAALSAASSEFQHLAFTTSTTLLVDKDDYARANGLMSLSEYLALVGAPLAAGLLVPVIGIGGILLIDLTTFVLAVALTALTSIPQPDAPPADERAADSGWRGLTAGFRYVFARRPFVLLLGLLFVFSTVEALSYPLIAPMLLARTGGDTGVLGVVQAVMGVGGIVGGLAISTLGGPRRRMIGVAVGVLCTGLFGDALLGLGQGLPVWLLAGFCLEVFIPLTISAHRAIWQAKVPPRLQGRVFAVVGFSATAAEPVTTLFGGVLADRVFEPAMQGAGWLAAVFGPLVGTGPGAGMALLFVFSGLLMAGAGLLALRTPALLEMERRLPDHGAEASAGG